MTRHKEVQRIVIMGAAGRDFHNFNVVFRDNTAYQVVAFTAAQIPTIAERKYPPKLPESAIRTAYSIILLSAREAFNTLLGEHQRVGDASSPALGAAFRGVRPVTQAQLQRHELVPNLE